jgi:hypothetical protein
MSRIGYLILLTLLVVLGTYVFWQQPEPPPLEYPWTKEAPTRYRVVHGDLVQEIDGEKVRIKGLERPLSSDKQRRLWAYVKDLGWLPKASITGVNESDLPQYGIDNSHELSCDGLFLRWGKNKKDYYLWDGLRGRIYISEASVNERLNTLSERLDDLEMLNLPSYTRITVDNITVALDPQSTNVDAARWRDVVRPQRPDFNLRVNKLYDLLSELRLRDLTSQQPRLVKPLHTLRFGTNDATIPEQTLRIWQEDQTAIIQVDNLPAQRIESATAQLWPAVLEMFKRDYLFNLYQEFARQPLAEVQVAVAGKQRFRLEKHGLRDVAEGRSQWDVVWTGGREPASAEAAPLLAFTLDKLYVDDPKPRSRNDEIPGSALTITFVFQQNRHTMVIALADGFVYSPTHVGKVVEMPDLLSDLTADRMLDPALTFRGAERVVKIQRQWFSGPQSGRAEVFAVQAGAGEEKGVWMQSWPKEEKGHAVSIVAIDQVARALCTAKGHDVRLNDAADRAGLAAPDFEMDVRFAPASVRLSNDHSRLVDTNDQDVGFAFKRIDGKWRAIDKDGGVSYGVSDELLELIQAPLIENLVLPLIPSLVTRLDIYQQQERFRLSQTDQGWQLQLLQANGTNATDSENADVIAVRRHLRLLANLRAERSDPQAGPFTPAELVGSVVCVFPGAEQGETRVTLSVGPTVDGLTAVVVEGGAGMRGLPRGRVYVLADMMQQILVTAKRFRSQTGATP